MMRTRSLVSFLVRCLVCMGVAQQVGCKFDLTRSQPPTCTKYVCKAKAYPCLSTMNKLEITLIGGTPCYSPQPDRIHLNPHGGLNTHLQLYCSPSPWVISEIRPARLAGSMWIRTNVAMGKKDGETQGVIFQLVDDAEGVYIAYDSRVSKKPDWLAEPNWVLAAEDAVNDVPGRTTQPLYITIDRPDTFNNRPFTLLEVWRRRLPLPKNTNIVIPGNLFGNPILPPGLEPNDVCMYLTIIKPTAQIDCSFIARTANPTDIGTYEYASCDDTWTEENGVRRCRTEAEIREIARVTFEQQLVKDYPGGTHALGEITSYPEGRCQDPCTIQSTTSHLLQSQAYKYHSEISFSSRESWTAVDVTVNNEMKSYTTNLSGVLQFEYLLDENNRMQQIRLNRLILNGTPIETDVGNFQNLVVDMLVPAIAACTDAAPPWATPCDGYRIEPNDFVASVGVSHDGSPISVLAQNSDAINVRIDHSTRSFVFAGGPLHTSLRVNDEDVPLDITMNLTGQFVNFAPVGRVGNEFVGRAGCGDNSLNATPIVLDAGASFEFYSVPLPVDPNSFQWYEDYGLLTEHHWGTGKVVTISPYALTFGVHHMTLLLRDDHGVVDVHRFNVEVADTVPPELTIPNDVIRLQAIGEALPLAVGIGEASASDLCCGQVLITNNAPAGLLFPAGQTLVTWQADDGRGNVTTHVQKVYVVGNPDRSIVARASDAARWLDGLISQERALLTARIAEPNCVLGLQRLIALTNQLAATLSAIGVPGEQTGARDSIVERLRASVAALTEANGLMAQSNENGAQRPTLRQDASARLSSASGSIQEIITMPEPGAGGLMPFCGFFPTGVLMCLFMCVTVVRRLAQRASETRGDGGHAW